MAVIQNVGDTVSYEIDMSYTEPSLRGHVEVKVESQNQQSRTSYVNIKLYLYRTVGASPINNTTFSGSITIPNQSPSLSVDYSTLISTLGSSRVLVGSANFTVNHNVDGTCTKNLQILCSYVSHLPTDHSESITLPTIPVSATCAIRPNQGDIYTVSTTVYITINSYTDTWSYTMRIRNANGDTYTLFTDLHDTYWSGILPNEVNYLFPNSSRATLYFDLIPKTAQGLVLDTYTTYRTVAVGSGSGPSITNIRDYPANADGSAYNSGYIAGVTYLKLTMHCVDYSGSTVNNIKTVVDGRECVATPIPNSDGDYQILTRYPLGTSGTLNIVITGTNNRGNSSNYNYAVHNIQPYFIPEINIFSVIRCDSNGVASSESRSIKVNFKITVRASVANAFTNSYNYYLAYRQHGNVAWTNFETGSGQANATSGNVCEVTREITKLNLFADATQVYDVRLLISDTLTGNVGTEVYKIIVSGIDEVMMDFKYDGSGAAVGKTAEESGVFDIGWAAKFSGGVYPTKLTETGTTFDLNNLKSPGFYYYSSLEGGNILNLPPIPGGVSGNYGIVVFPTGISSVLQLFIPEAVGSNPSFCMRTVSSTTQVSSWRQVTGVAL